MEPLETDAGCPYDRMGAEGAGVRSGTASPKSALATAATSTATIAPVAGVTPAVVPVALVPPPSRVAPWALRAPPPFVLSEPTKWSEILEVVGRKGEG